MFYYFSREENKVITKWTEMTWVTEFEHMRQQWGFNALQYMFYFCSAASPFAKDTDPLLRHNKVIEQIRMNPWVEHERKLPNRFFEDPLFRRAETRFKNDYDDEIELEEEKIIKEARRALMNQIKFISTSRESDISAHKEAIRAIVDGKKKGTKGYTKESIRESLDAYSTDVLAALIELIDNTFVGLTPAQLTHLNTMLTQLTSLAKHHEEKKKAAKDRIVVDNSPSVIFGDTEPMHS